MALLQGNGMDTRPNHTSGLQISKKSFFSAFFILLVLILMAGVLTRVVDTGRYQRILTEKGEEKVVSGTYQRTQEERLPIWRWFNGSA